MAAAAILDFLNLHFRIPLFLITHWMKYILAKFRENPINSNEIGSMIVKFKMAAAAILVLD
jgi:hypothetical protein